MTVARFDSIDIALHWRWLLLSALATSALAEYLLPGRVQDWDTPTIWLASAAAVIASELALLLHELSHALVARRYGARTQTIVFHGFVAETLLSHETMSSPRRELVVALIGPVVNLGLAGAVQAVRLTLVPAGPLDTLLVLLVLGNLAAAAMSLVPFGASDGARILRALRARGCR